MNRRTFLQVIAALFSAVVAPSTPAARPLLPYLTDPDDWYIVPFKGEQFLWIAPAIVMVGDSIHGMPGLTLAEAIEQVHRTTIA
jgi:hypothetical protein